MIYNYIIIGAGLSGLTSANLLGQNQIDNVLVLDKSRGVGGRMATRRTLETKFDHGAQFYRLTDDSKNFHTKWRPENITAKWFENEKGEYWRAIEGMTALPKFIAKNLPKEFTVELEKEISDIQFEHGIWHLTSLKNEKWQTKNLIISSPLPQTIKLLKTIQDKKSLKLEVITQLEKISYTKALIGLVTTENEIDLNDHGYLEFNNSPFFSITSMKAKGLSAIPAYTFTMSAEFSENYFEQDDSSTLKLILEKIQDTFIDIKIKNSELKKWRYCMPTTKHTNYFEEIAPNLF